ncbi:MAG: methyl-accepting chemotaxis protein [Campylobacterota bacterium]|nr:methyl-accepting chemotaxis protein [Campylobacterota bacterium]
MFNNMRMSTKILLPMVLILIISNVITNYMTTNKMEKLAYDSANSSLNMLTDSIFLTLRNAMNTGDPAVIKKAEEDSRKNITGLTNLTVAKSKETIEMYSPTQSFTTDNDILDVFQTKKTKLVEVNTDNTHSLRVVRPMIATQECMMCHANQNIGDVIGVIDLTFSLDESDEMISNTILSIITVALTFIILNIIIVWFSTKKATAPLLHLKNDLDEFFKFLAHEKDDIEPFKVYSMDEVGEMVVSINKNIEQTKKGLQQDAKAIQQSSEISEKASEGNLAVKITAVANNPEINNLTEIINHLIDSTYYNIKRVLKTLNAYIHDEYKTRVNSKGKTTEQIKELFTQVDLLGNTLTELSGQNLYNGKALQQSSLVLSENVNKLQKSSNEQAQTLYKSSESINSIMADLEHTTKNSQDMLAIAKELTSSSVSGEKLAEQTTTAMENINDKVMAINEAVSIIDQISFQTNILSLNAAVEAATAGEAGKGFAVVAQEVRNLASRSADAANEIKDLVQTALNQSSDGMDISTKMIDGYQLLNENIKTTTGIINIVVDDTNTQKIKLESIHGEVNILNKQAKENVNIAESTYLIAEQSNDIAQKIVDDATAKDFPGKDDVVIRKNIIDPFYEGPERRKIEGSMKNNRRKKRGTKADRKNPS